MKKIIIILSLIITFSAYSQNKEKGTFFNPIYEDEISDSCDFHLPKHTAYLKNNKYYSSSSKIILIKYKLIKKDKCLKCNKWVVFESPLIIYIKENEYYFPLK